MNILHKHNLYIAWDFLKKEKLLYDSNLLTSF